jgi:AraC-like DNA-binding protein
MRHRILNDESSFWQVAELRAQFLHGTFQQLDYDVHAHDTACFASLTAGRSSMQIRNETFQIRPGEICAIDAFVPHAGGGPTIGDTCSVRLLFVDLNEIGLSLGDERQSVTLAGSPIIRDPELCASFHEFHVSSRAVGDILYRDERYLVFAALLFDRHTRAASAPAKVGKEGRAIERAQEFLHDYLDQRVCLAEIADAATLPPYRLLRSFHRAIGMTPHAYQRQARIREAMKLIRRGRSLSEAATETGFADQAHLTRTFRKVMGITPGSYQSAFS